MSPARGKPRGLLTHVSPSVASWFTFRLTWACSPHHCPIDKRVFQDLPSCGSEGERSRLPCLCGRFKGQGWGPAGSLNCSSSQAPQRHSIPCGFLSSSFFLNQPSTDLCPFKSQLGFPSGSDRKQPTCKAEDSGSIPASGRSLEKEMATHPSILA